MNVTQKDMDEFLQWQKDSGKAKYGLTDIYVNDNGKMSIEKRMAWIIKISPEDWKEFCNATNRECTGKIEFLAMY